jgi:hypothetical protein
MGPHPSNGMLLALPTNIRLGKNRMAPANTLAYYDATTITALKSFILQDLELKNFFPTLIVAVL